MAQKVTNEHYVNFRITDAQGFSRTFKINNVVSDSTTLQNAVKNFGDNFVVDDEKNILITGRTDENIIGYSADLITTEKVEDFVSGGEQYPLILSPCELTFSTDTSVDQTLTISIPNATGQITTTYITGQQGSALANPTFSWNAQDSELRITYGQSRPTVGKISTYKCVDEDGKTGFFTITMT